MANRLYRRLPGRSSGLIVSTSLWEADDHLLLVESTRVNETYRRFFFRDIQAIVICRTKTWLITGIVAMVMALLFGLAVAVTSEVTLKVFLAVPAVLAALVGLAALLQGPTCRCTLRTAVQTQALPSLGRLHGARKMCRRLQWKIEAAQSPPPAP